MRVLDHKDTFDVFASAADIAAFNRRYPRPNLAKISRLKFTFERNTGKLKHVETQAESVETPIVEAALMEFARESRTYGARRLGLRHAWAQATRVLEAQKRAARRPEHKSLAGHAAPRSSKTPTSARTIARETFAASCRTATNAQLDLLRRRSMGVELRIVMDEIDKRARPGNRKR